MARRRTAQKDRTRNIPLEFGGMWRSGDPRRIPEGHVRLLRNMYLRPGRIEKRDPWTREGTLPSTPDGFFLREDGTNTHLGYVANGTAQFATRSSGGVWSNVSAAGGFYDFATYDTDVYVLATQQLYHFDGTTATAIGQDGILGDTCTTFIRRIFLGGTELGSTNLAAGLSVDPLTDSVAFGFNNASYWTKSGFTNASVGNRYGFNVNSSGDYAYSATLASTGSERFLTWTPEFLSNYAEGTIPLTIRITNAAGTTVYASKQIVLQSATDNNTWQKFFVGGLIPASTTYRLEIRANANTPNQPFYCSETTAGDIHGTNVSVGKFIFDSINTYSNMTVTYDYKDRFYWSETDDPDTWLATNYYQCDEVAGNITTVRPAKDRLWAFKDSAVWGFRPTGRDAPAILQESFHKGFGCVGPKAYAQFRGDSIFIGKDEVYAWNHESDPLELAGPGMREEMFDQSDFLGSDAVLEVDYEDKEIYCYTRPGKLYVYNLDEKGWSVFSLTGASDAELNIKDLIFAKANGDTRAKVWAIMDATADIVQLDVSATQENITGTNRDVVAKIQFRPLGTTNPRDRLQIQKIGIDHQIQTTQTSTTTTASVSFNGGNTFPRTNQITIDDLASADGDMKRLHIPLRQSGYYQMVEIKHTGLAGPDAFNIYGGDVEILLRGAEKDEETPTQGSAALT